jgi:hypothetical protein
MYILLESEYAIAPEAPPSVYEFSNPVVDHNSSQKIGLVNE